MVLLSKLASNPRGLLVAALAVLGVGVLRRLLKSPKALMAFLKLQEVQLSMLRFAPPNPLIPENVRGVWWILLGPGVVTVDLNRLLPVSSLPENTTFYIQDVEPDYQTISNDLPGLRLWLFATLCKVRSHVKVDAEGPQVSWSAFGGLLPFPFNSPSRRVNEHEVERLIAKSWSGKVIHRYRALRVVDANGQKTQHFQAMIDKFQNVALGRPRAAPEAASIRRGLVSSRL